MAWRVAESLKTLLAEINDAYPNRDKRTDGAISGYPGSISSHNINSAGVVCALDITTGPYAAGINDAQGQDLAERIRVALRDDPRGIPCYVIHFMEPPYVAVAGAKIATANNNWAWQPYGGSSPHLDHVHVSVDWDIYTGGAPSGQADYDLTLPWGISSTLTGQGDKITIIKEDTLSAAEVKQITDALQAERITIVNEIRANANNVGDRVGNEAYAVKVFAQKVMNENGDRVITDSRAQAQGVPTAVLNQAFTANSKTVNLAGLLASIDAKPAPTVTVTLDAAQIVALSDQLRATLPASTVAALAAKLA